MTDTKNFLGIPISGDISYGEKRVDQRPLEELAPIMQAVLDDPTIVAFGWLQYTPYFNDGDPCVFSAHSLWVQTDQDHQKTSEFYHDPYEFQQWREEELTVGYSHPTLGKRGSERVDGRWIDKGYIGSDKARYDRCVALAHAIERGAFHDVLLENFGDHATITVKKTGITVEEYSHD